MGPSIIKRGLGFRSGDFAVPTKAELARFARELKARLPNAGEPARDYYLQAFQFLTSIKANSHVESRLECLDAVFQYFYGARDAVTAVMVAEAFEQLASKGSRTEWIRKSKSYCGVAFSDIGDVHRGVVKYREALRIAREMHDVVAEAVVVLNLGAALFYAGLYTDAQKCYEHVCALAQARPEVATMGSPACSNMAQLCLRQERYELGLEYVRSAASFGYETSSPLSNLHHVILERVHVELALRLGKTELADGRLRVCEAFARRAQTLRAQFEATMARGLCEIDHGDVETGLNALHHALDTAVLDHERVLCLTELIFAYERRGDVEKAIQYVDQLCESATLLYQSAFRALSQANEFAGATLRRDQLESYALKRSKLESLALNKRATHARRELIERLALTAQLKDESSGLHGERVGRLSGFFAKSLGLRCDAAEQIEVAGRLHDIGKIAIPDPVLRSAGTRTATERELLNAHARIGADLLAQSAIPELQCAEIVARHHHERWDGEGYPSRMKGKRIPVECRIVAIVDCFDAMTHGRPHVAPVSASVALGEILVQKGKQFDPELSDAFVGFMHGFMAEHPDVSTYLEQSARKSPLTDAMRELGDLLAAVSHESQVERSPARAPAPPLRSRPAPSTRPPESL